MRYAGREKIGRAVSIPLEYVRELNIPDGSYMKVTTEQGSKIVFERLEKE
jgi:antitoxin component of MazEF toxin-antitoxin module